MRACFFARVKDRPTLERVEFYKQDIDVLRDCGFDVTIATRWREISGNADLYFIWWWQWAFLPLLKARRSGRPCLVTGTFNFETPTRGAYFSRPVYERALMAYALRHAAANVFVSELECRQVTQALRVNNPSYIPHGVDTDVYCPGTPVREDFLLSVAWLNQGNAQRKSVPETIKAFALLRDRYPRLRLLVVGERGSAYPELARLAQDQGLGSAVEFLGAIPRDEKISLMQRCRVYVSPSRYEGFGLAVLEAMSCGAPVVSSPVGAVPEVVADAGLLVDGTSPVAIADAVSRYLEDDALAAEMGTRGRHRAEQEFPYTRRRDEMKRVILQIM